MIYMPTMVNLCSVLQSELYALLITATRGCNGLSEVLSIVRAQFGKEVRQFPNNKTLNNPEALLLMICPDLD